MLLVMGVVAGSTGHPRAWAVRGLRRSPAVEGFASAFARASDRPFFWCSFWVERKDVDGPCLLCPEVVGDRQTDW